MESEETFVKPPSLAREVPDRAVGAEFDVGAMGENSHRRLHKLADGEFGAPPPLAG